jgi:hypothetical protein
LAGMYYICIHPGFLHFSISSDIIGITQHIDYQIIYKHFQAIIFWRLS